MDKSPDAFRTISEVAEDLDLPQHVLRFWETRFAQIKPMKRTGGRRYYRPDDVALVRAIKGLLYGQGYTIKGVQRLLKENGVRALVAAAQAGRVPAQPALPLELSTPVAADADEPAEPAAVTARPAMADAAGMRAGAGLVGPERLRALASELADCVRILRAAQG